MGIGNAGVGKLGTSATGGTKADIAASLRERERELEEAHRIARLGTWKWVRGMDSPTWSAEVFRIFGVDPGTPAPRDGARTLLVEKSWREVTAARQRAWELGEPYAVDVELAGEGDGPRWVHVRGEVAERDVDGNVTMLRGTMQDVTERKLTEARLRNMAETLREAQSRFERLYEGNLVGIAYPNRQGGFSDGNDEFLRIVGYTREELKAGLVRWDRMTPPEYRELDVKHILEARERGACTPYEKEFIRKDGRRVPIMCGYALLQGSEDEYIGFVGDLTAQKVAARAITEREKRFRELADSLPGLVWEADPDGRITYVNQQWVAYTGVGQSEFRGGLAVELVHPEDAERTVKQRQQSVAEGTPYTQELRLRHHDGSYRYFLSRAVPVRNDAGEVERWLGTATDIHEQKLAEEVLRRTEKLAATGRLAASMAHEINNPLESVTNSLYLALQDPGLSAETKMYLEMADRELQRVAHVTTQTLRFHRQSRRPAKEDMGPLMDSAMGLFEGRMATLGVMVEREYMTSEQLLCCGDELRQVFANLLSNAVDAMHGGGRIRVRVAKVKAWDEARREGLRISVGDTGHGIPTEMRGKIFEAFVTTKEATGTGLGLWVSTGIVQKHGGRMTLRSCEGKGTVFSVFLPMDGPLRLEA
jgi:PAS domain S-box-containing protein